MKLMKRFVRLYAFTWKLSKVNWRMLKCRRHGPWWIDGHPTDISKIINKSNDFSDFDDEVYDKLQKTCEWMYVMMLKMVQKVKKVEALNENLEKGKVELNEQISLLTRDIANKQLLFDATVKEFGSTKSTIK